MSNRVDTRKVGLVINPVMGVEASMTPGVWRGQGTDTWELYRMETAEIIFAAYCSGEKSAEWVDSTVSLTKRKRDAAHDHVSSTLRSTTSTHVVDFERMKEVNVFTGMETSVKIVQATISDINYKATEDPIETGVWWKHDSGLWHCYSHQAVEQIRNAWRRKEHLLTLKKVYTRRYPQGVKYIINLTEMTQTNPVTGNMHPIQIISSASLPSEILSPTGGKKLTVFSLGSNLLRGGLHTLMSLEFLQSIAAKMVLEPHKVEAIQLNKHLLYSDIGQTKYQRFRNAYDTIIQRVPGCCGQLMRLAKENRLDADVWGGTDHILMKYVLFLAPPHEFENILNNGLHGGQYHIYKDSNFAVTTNYYELHHKSWESLDYNLLLFLVLIPTISGASNRFVNAIPLASVEEDHQLPVAVLKLRNLMHPRPELLALESGQSVATGSNHYCATPNSRLESPEVTTTSCPTAHPIVPRLRLKGEMSLLFKVYLPEVEQLCYVGGLGVHEGSKPTQIVEWLVDMAGFPPKTEIQLYKDSSTTIIDQKSTFGENKLEDGGVLIYNRALMGLSRRRHRCPDWPAFTVHLSNRQVMHFRRLSNPTENEFSLEVSKQATYSDVVERVAQHLGLEDDGRIRLTFNDCFFQRPKQLPLDSCSFSALLVNTYKQTTSLLYFEILDFPPVELDGSKTLTVAFHDAKGERLSVHEIEIPKRSRVRDVVERLRGKIKELRNRADIQMRIFEVYCNRVTRIHPSNERVGYVSTQESSSKFSLRAVEIPEEEKELAPGDQLLHVRHLHCRDDASRKCDFFGEPFLLVVREHETLAHVKERIKSRVQMCEPKFLDCKFSVLSAGRREYLQDDDLVASRMEKFSLGFYDPIHYYLGIEHADSSKSWRLTSKQKLSPKPSKAQSDSRSQSPKGNFPNHKRNEDKVLCNQAPQPSHVKAGSALLKSKTPGISPQQRRDEIIALEKKLAPTIVPPLADSMKRSHPGTSSKFCSLALLPPSICKLSRSWSPPNRVVTQVTVPDPEFHNFDSLRSEKDVLSGQVWAIYDNHDGMPRFYGRISQVSRSPFKVELSWLDPPGKKRRWVETTGLSITCGEYEVSKIFEIETDIGVFSHLVLEKASSTELLKVYPKKGEIWAIYRNWDVSLMVGPEPIPTPNGTFPQSYEYDIVEIIGEYSEEDGVEAVRLVKTKGFKTVFHPQEGPLGIKIFLPRDMQLFSHSIPAEKLDHHLPTIPQEALELDPASLPLDLTVIEGLPATGVGRDADS